MQYADRGVFRMRDLKRFFQANKEGALIGGGIGIGWILLQYKIPALKLLPQLFGLRFDEPWQSIIIISIFIIVGIFVDMMYKKNE